MVVERRSAWVWGVARVGFSPRAESGGQRAQGGSAGAANSPYPSGSDAQLTNFTTLGREIPTLPAPFGTHHPLYPTPRIGRYTGCV